MAYSWGRLDDIVASRLSLPIYILCVLCIAAITREIKEKYVVLLGFLFAGALYWSSFPLAAKNYSYKMYSSAQTLALFEEFQQRQPDRRFAVLNGISNYWLTRDVYSVSPPSLRSNPEFLVHLLKSGEFRRVYLIQTFRRDTKTNAYVIDRSDYMPVEVETELISEDRVTDDRIVRVSYIKSSTGRLKQRPEVTVVAR
jgi:hypothetical protein